MYVRGCDRQDYSDPMNSFSLLAVVTMHGSM